MHVILLASVTLLLVIVVSIIINYNLNKKLNKTIEKNQTLVAKLSVRKKILDSIIKENETYEKRIEAILLQNGKTNASESNG